MDNAYPGLPQTIFFFFSSYSSTTLTDLTIALWRARHIHLRKFPNVTFFTTPHSRNYMGEWEQASGRTISGTVT